MKTKTSRIVLGILVIALFAGVSLLWAQEDVNLSPAKQQFYDLGFAVFPDPVDAYDFTATLRDGSNVRLSDYSDKLVLINLWATWCPPCRAEMPSMQELYDTLNPRGFEILAVAFPSPPQETVEKIYSFVDQNGFSFPVLIDHTFSVSNIYGTGSIPTSYIVDAEGHLVARLKGAINWSDEKIVAAFESLLPQ